MLPIPIEKYLPSLWSSYPDAKYTAFVNKVNSILLAWQQSIFGLYDILDPMKCPVSLLEELGYYLSAGINQSDSETLKRYKCEKAVALQKNRGRWQDTVLGEYYAKGIIDTITGYDARLLHWWDYDTDDWILAGDGTIETIWLDISVFGGDGTSPYGFSFIGGGTEIEVQGNVYINCHYGITTPVLSAATILTIVNSIKDDICPAYFHVYLGYIDGTGAFVVYSGGAII